MGRVVATGAGSPSAHDQLAINDVVYAELSIGYARMEQLDAMISSAGLVCAVMPRPALFLAGKAFQRYRSAGGRKTGVLPDFFIGAHAVIADAPVDHPRCGSLSQLFPGDHADRPVVIAAPGLSGSNGEGAARA
jgi:predicted nucleic acid-binding protein